MTSQYTRVLRLIRKELSEIFRDRRTILTLVLMPVLVYPLLMLVFQQYFLASRLAHTQSYRVGFASEPDYLHFQSHIDLGTIFLAGQDPRAAPDALTFDPHVSSDLLADVTAGNIDLGIRVKSERRVWQDHQVSLEFIYKPESRAAQTLVRYFERRMAATTAFYLQSRLGVPDRPFARLAWPVHTLVEETAPPRVSLAAVIPLILILMTITGAVYPAIDLTAGERERGTLEILIAAPVPRMGLLFAKYVCVFSVAILTALVNLGMMLLTLRVSPVGAQLHIELSLPVIAQILGLLLLFAAFFSAVLLTITSFARSFKEAQAYLIPVMLLALGPGVVGILPGLKLESWLSVAPLVNIVLLGRDLFEQTAGPLMAAVVVGSTLLYALAALAVAARIFGAEAVLYSEQRAWSDLWRRPAEPRQAPTVGSAILCLALMFPAWFVLQGFQGELHEFSVVWVFIWLSFWSVLLFAGFPLFAAYMTRVELRPGFQLRPTRIAAYLGGLVLGPSLCPLVLQMLAYLVPADSDLDASVLDKLRAAREDYPAALLAAMIVIAVAEELFFRGYLFSALRFGTSRFGARGAWRRAGITILVSAVLFGFFHMLTTPLFPFPRFLSSTVMGLVLGSVAWQTGSVIPGMLLHGGHNVVLVLLGKSDLADLGEISWTWVGAGSVGLVVGAVLLFLGRRNRVADTA
jgi:ABC-2 type transport system permease protein/sodium transport system permease protein